MACFFTHVDFVMWTGASLGVTTGGESCVSMQLCKLHEIAQRRFMMLNTHMHTISLLSCLLSLLTRHLSAEHFILFDIYSHVTKKLVANKG